MLERRESTPGPYYSLCVEFLAIPQYSTGRKRINTWRHRRLNKPKFYFAFTAKYPLRFLKQPILPVLYRIVTIFISVILVELPLRKICFLSYFSEFLLIFPNSIGKTVHFSILFLVIFSLNTMVTVIIDLDHWSSLIPSKTGLNIIAKYPIYTNTT